MQKSGTLRVLIVDSHYIIRVGLREFLAATFDCGDVLEATTKDECLQVMDRTTGIDVVIVDLYLPNRLSEAGLREICSKLESTPVLVCTQSESLVDMQFAMSAGARGFLSKASERDALESAIRAVMSGGTYFLWHSREPGGAATRTAAQASSMNGKGRISRLTRRQRDVLSLLAEGMPNQAIAESLGLTLSTVKGHVSKILDVLGAENRTQATLILKQLDQG